MNKEEILGEIVAAWDEFQDVLSKVPPERVEEGGVVEEWSVKDLMGHVTTWEDCAMTVISCYLREGSWNLPEWPGLDAFNARNSAAKKPVPLKSIQYDLNKTHERMVEYIEGLSEENIALEKMQERIRLDTYEHYREHAAHIQNWLEI